MKFLIQTVEGQIATDMGRSIVEAHKLANFLGRDPIEYELSENHKGLAENIVPVGTIEWTEQISGKNLVPTNLPEILCRHPFIQRDVFWCSGPELAARFMGLQEDPMSSLAGKKLFVKSGSRIKGFDPVITNRFLEVPQDTRYFVSEVIKIRAEYRAFIFHHEILDVKQYAGAWDDPLSQEQIQSFKNMIHEAHLPYSACTIDFAINGKRAVELLEVHNFISCGLYGFDDPIRVAKMAARAWSETI